MTAPLTGKVAIVTGAAQGIGAAYARHLAALGAAVVIADVNTEGGEKTAAALCADGFSATFTRTDVADEASVAALVDGAVATYGGVDILVNNAAIYQGVRQNLIEDLEVAYWRRMMDVNVTGVFIASRAVIPAMKARGGGVIVNQASTGAFMNAPTLTHYAVSKAAVVAFTRNLAVEVGPANIRVNAIAPGFTLSEATLANFPESYHAVAAGGSALGRNGTPDDLCGTLEYLVTEASAWMTGQTLVVDGGKVFPR